MTHDETRGNTTATENQLRKADAHADTREGDDNRCMENRVADGWFATLHAKAKVAKEAREADHVHNSRHIRLAEEHHPEHNDGANGYDDDDDDDIEEDDGQPSEYVEWQDYMGGDDWDYGQCDDCGW